jgi:hypothetical protein
MPIYRLFPVRVYRATHWVDVDAPDWKTAWKASQYALNHFDPDPRLVAADNGWVLDDYKEETIVPFVGSPHPTPSMKLLLERTYKYGMASVFISDYDHKQTVERYWKEFENGRK